MVRQAHHEREEAHREREEAHHEREEAHREREGAVVRQAHHEREEAHREREGAVVRQAHPEGEGAVGLAGLGPVEFAQEVLGVELWAKQKEVLAALPENRRVAVKSGNGLGKGFSAAVAVLWFLHSHDPAIVLSTAPTFRQVRHILWRQIHSLHRRAPDILKGKLLDTRWELSDDRYATGLSADTADQFQGFHSPNMLIVVDEAEGVGDGIYEAIEAVMTSAEPRLLLIGNPTTASGVFRRAFYQERSIYHCITISALDSPNVQSDRVVIPGLTTARWVEERRQIWGVDNPLYRARVLGEFPDQAEDTLIRLSDVEAAVLRQDQDDGGGDALTPGPSPGGRGEDGAAARRGILRDDGGTGDGVVRQAHHERDVGDALTPGPSPGGRGEDGAAARRGILRDDGGTGDGVVRQAHHERDVGDALTPGPSPGGRGEDGAAARRGILRDEGEVVLAVDVARFGSDHSVILRRRGQRVEEIRTFNGMDTMELAGWVAAAIREFQPTQTCIDEVGVGAGVVDRLREQGYGVRGINVAHAARQKEVFANLRAEGYWRLRELFASGQISIPSDQQLMGELAALRYSYDSQGRILMESKEDMRKRGIPSPDKADALMLSFIAPVSRARIWT